ncbi:hypothetical protein TRICHSKD4_2883 [Roseibium sp. TrichSKD4]|nr:hypothetical protein TRICHSKD4_2883 [Roseibium sp. TrichSKD4]
MFKNANRNQFILAGLQSLKGQKRNSTRFFTCCFRFVINCKVPGYSVSASAV